VRYCGGDGTTSGIGLRVEEFEIIGQGEDGEKIGVRVNGCEKEAEEVVLGGWGV
jgi:hypothetical protein